MHQCALFDKSTTTQNILSITKKMASCFQNKSESRLHSSVRLVISTENLFYLSKQKKVMKMLGITFVLAAVSLQMSISNWASALSSVCRTCSVLLLGVCSGWFVSLVELGLSGLVTPGMSGRLGGVRARGDVRHCRRNFLS